MYDSMELIVISVDLSDFESTMSPFVALFASFCLPLFSDLVIGSCFWISLALQFIVLQAVDLFSIGFLWIGRFLPHFGVWRGGEYDFGQSFRSVTLNFGKFKVFVSQLYINLSDSAASCSSSPRGSFVGKFWESSCCSLGLSLQILDHLHLV